MELTLNLIWLAIVAGSLCELLRWRLHQTRSSDARRTRLVGTAVICLLALLFPIISITDDLCNDVLLVETSVKRRPAHDAAHNGASATAVAIGVIRASEIRFHLRAGGMAVAECVAIGVAGALHSCSARAPPLQPC